MKIRNAARERLEGGDLALGIGLRHSRTVEVARALRVCGYDWLFIDMEHSTVSLDDAANLSVAAQDAGIAPVVRVPGFEHHHASRILDGGAQGVVVPHVDTADVAARMVANCKYPPVGTRSIYGALPQADFGVGVGLAEMTEAVNASTLVVVMVETPTAVENVDSIAATEGVDAVLVGSNDLCIEMGIPGEFGNPRLESALERVVAACRAHGKHPGLGGVYDPALMRRYIDLGMRLVLCGSDLSLMMSAATQRAGTLREIPL